MSSRSTTSTNRNAQWPPHELASIVKHLLSRCKRASDLCAANHQKGRPTARKPYCPNHPDGIHDGTSLVFPEGAIASALVALRLYQSSSSKRQHTTALTHVQSLMTGFSEGSYDADFAHIQTGKSDMMTVQVCLRAMQGYELERLGRGNHKSAAACALCCIWGAGISCADRFVVRCR